jgi:hypothetical protein
VDNVRLNEFINRRAIDSIAIFENHDDERVDGRQIFSRVGLTKERVT